MFPGILGTSCGRCRSAPAFVSPRLCTGSHKERRPTKTVEEQTNKLASKEKYDNQIKNVPDSIAPEHF